MTIGKKIIFSSSFVAFLAGLAVVMACKNTKPIQNELVENIKQTKEEIQILDKIKYQLFEIQLNINKKFRSSNYKFGKSNQDFTSI